MRTSETRLQKLLEELHVLKEEFSTKETVLRKEIQNELKEYNYQLPGSLYATDLTPLETTAWALKNYYFLSNKEIASRLNRSESAISQAIANAHTKTLPYWPRAVQYWVDLTYFKKDLTPAQAVIYSLHKQKLSTAKIARLIGRDPRNVQSTLQKAKKRGKNQ